MKNPPATTRKPGIIMPVRAEVDAKALRELYPDVKILPKVMDFREAFGTLLYNL